MVKHSRGQLLRKQFPLTRGCPQGGGCKKLNHEQKTQQHNKPIELWSGKVIKQKIDYIHNNPVEQGFVTDPVDWKYSSARNYADNETVLKIDNQGMHLGMMEL